MPDRFKRNSVAFFDVDETLVSARTLESFLMYYLQQVPSMVSPDRIRELRSDVVNLNRVEFNREYFALWAGQPAARVHELGKSWYQKVSVQPGFFRSNVIQRLRDHQQAGAYVVLVSGSFSPPLQPIADEIGIDAMYCTQLETSDSGLYTGRIRAAMLGDDKRGAVDDFVNGLARESVDTWGYGDHMSDLSLLEHVTHPVVVGTDPALTTIAAERNWPILPIEQQLAPRAHQE